MAGHVRLSVLGLLAFLVVLYGPFMFMVDRRGCLHSVGSTSGLVKISDSFIREESERGGGGDRIPEGEARPDLIDRMA
jgi:hypothetical protein